MLRNIIAIFQNYHWNIQVFALLHALELYGLCFFVQNDHKP